MQKKVKIIVATHKKYEMPNDDIYIPLHVGAEGKFDSNGEPLELGYIKDDTGDNISSLNSSFCELTGLYWAWKNLDSDYIGLAHYRRHFSMNGKKGFQNVMSYNEIAPYLDQIRVFVPNKRRYFIESLYSHYGHTHYSVHLDETRCIISELYPKYLNIYDKVLKKTSGYMFNMMILEKELMNEYCEWLFCILFELKKRINMPELDVFQSRFYGRVSEIIFNVWLEYKFKSGEISKNEVKEIKCIQMERINWFKKGGAFLKAKFIGKKYKGSF